MERVIGLLDAIEYVRRYTGQTFVVKAGGQLFEKPGWGDGVARDVAALHRLGIHVVLVHGGGPQLDRAADFLNLDNARVAGRRITSPELIDAASMVWRGRLSVQIVSALARHGERGIGLSGVDGGLLTADKRPPMVVVDDDGERKSVDYGLVGDLTFVDVEVVRAITQIPAIPVVSPLASGAGGQVLNVNADTVAAHLAVALGAAKLILLTQAPGILEDPADPNSVLHWTDLVQLQSLRDAGHLKGGMGPKLAAISHALNNGVPRVHVVDGRRSGALLEEVFTNDGSGTLVVREANDTPPEPVGMV